MISDGTAACLNHYGFGPSLEFIGIICIGNPFMHIPELQVFY